MSFDVQGKTALVTGANRGIGKAIVQSLLSHGSAKVYAAVRDLDSARPLVDEHGEKVVPVHIDLGEPETISAAAKQANDVQLVVSNAGVLKTAEPPSTVSEGIVSALKAGEFHLFPDSFAKQIGEAYDSFAKNVVEADLMNG